jgi:hypothetical protein
MRVRGRLAEAADRTDGPGSSDLGILRALRSALVDEGVWLQQQLTSHDRTGDRSTLTIDFTWVDVATGESLGPVTFIGYGHDPLDGVPRAMAAATVNFIRQTFLLDPREDRDAAPRSDGQGASRGSAGRRAAGYAA